MTNTQYRWSKAPLKHTCILNRRVLSEKTDPDHEIEYLDIGNVDSYGNILGTEIISFEKSPSRARRIASHGDTIVSTVRTYLRAITGIFDPPEKLVVSTGFAVLSPKIFIEPRFLSYFCRSEQFIDSVIANSTGVSYPAITPSDLGNLEISFPPRTQQTRITDFLDRETSRIDKLIEKEERLLKLIEEKRTALISHAVTKGLDPNAELKDSGIEWLGKIPKDWNVVKIKRKAIVRRGASPRPIDDPQYFDDDGDYAWVRISDVTASDHYLTETTQRLSAIGKSKSVPLEPGEIFVSICASVGKPIITKIKCCIHDGFVYFHRSKFSSEYLYYVFMCGEIYKGHGKTGTQLNLNTDTIGNLCIPDIPLDNQQEIVEYLSIVLSKHDALKKKINEAIDLLREKRTALISAAVTGKISI